MKKKLILLAALSMMISCNDNDDISNECSKEIVNVVIFNKETKILKDTITNEIYTLDLYDYIISVEDKKTGLSTQITEYKKREVPQLNECY